jgi:hypothetical protein
VRVLAWDPVQRSAAFGDPGQTQQAVGLSWKWLPADPLNSAEVEQRALETNVDLFLIDQKESCRVIAGQRGLPWDLMVIGGFYWETCLRRLAAYFSTGEIPPPAWTS